MIRTKEADYVSHEKFFADSPGCRFSPGNCLACSTEAWGNSRYEGLAASSYCKGDDMMAEYFPPGIRFVRPHTLGRGDALCDFQYCRNEKGITASDSSMD
jgi:hypothetical protein